MRLGIALLGLLALVPSVGWGIDVPPGEHRCVGPEEVDKNAPEVKERFLKGLCIYQARNTGDEVYAGLLRVARISFQEQLDANAALERIEPVEGPGRRTVLWWISNDAANAAVGRRMAEFDHHWPINPVPKVIIRATLYSFEKSFNRELGLKVAAFYGPKTAAETATNGFANSLVSGLFSIATGLANPYASILNLGVHAAMDRKHSEVVTEVVYECEVGARCENAHESTFFYQHPAGVKESTIGIHIKTTPRIDPKNPTLVELGNLSFAYSVPTEKPDSPVDVYSPYMGRNLVLNTDELFVLGSEVNNRDVRSGKLLESGVEKAHTQLLIMVQVSVDQKGMGGAQPVSLDLNKAGDRTYSKEELEKLPNGELSLREILDSVQLVCFKDLINPATREQICGFHFTRMDRKYLNYILQFKLSGKVKYMEEKVSQMTIGELFTEKGYYQLPMLDDSKAGNYKLTVELDKSSAPAKVLRKTEKVKGMKLQFGYYPGKAEPILFAPGTIRWIE